MPLLKSTLIKSLVTKRYTFGSRVREHILKMSNMTSKLKPVKMELNDQFVVHFIFASLPKDFEEFVVNYNSQPDKWGIEKLIAMCVQVEERIKSMRGEDTVNHLKGIKNKNYFKNNCKPSFKTPSHPPKNDHHQRYEGKGKGKMHMKEVDKDTCKHYKQKGHYMKDCVEFLKWMNKNDKNEIIDEVACIDESLYLEYSDSTCRIDSGATVHVANFIQGFATRRILAKGQRSL
jgi:hypothetical protein